VDLLVKRGYVREIEDGEVLPLNDATSISLRRVSGTSFRA